MTIHTLILFVDFLWVLRHAGLAPTGPRNIEQLNLKDEVALGHPLVVLGRRLDTVAAQQNIEQIVRLTVIGLTVEIGGEGCTCKAWAPLCATHS